MNARRRIIATLEKLGLLELGASQVATLTSRWSAI